MCFSHFLVDVVCVMNRKHCRLKDPKTRNPQLRQQSLSVNIKAIYFECNLIQNFSVFIQRNSENIKIYVEAWENFG